MRSTPRWASALVAALWAGWLFIFGTGEARRVPGLSSVVGEPLQHLVAFAVLAALIMLTVRSKPLAVFVVVIGVGLLGELIQLPIPDREFAWSDLVMDTIGASIGIIVVTRFPGSYTRVGTMLLAAALMVIGPFAPEADPDMMLTFPEDCGDPPPPIAIEPAVILDESGLLDAMLPVEIGEPSVAQLREQLMVTNELTVETWFETDDLTQSGPVRVFTISDGTAEDQMNLHVGIEGNGVSVRLRTSCNIFNWVIATDVIEAHRPQHVAFTWQQARLAVWVNGEEVLATDNPWGDFARWDPEFDIIVGDEKGGGRGFDGVVYSVTMWNAALDEASIVGRSADVPMSG